MHINGLLGSHYCRTTLFDYLHDLLHLILYLHVFDD